MLDEAEQDIATIAEDRDRLAMLAHCEKQKAQKIEDYAMGLQQRITELEEALARVTAERDTAVADRDALLAAQHGATPAALTPQATPASVARVLRQVVHEHGGNVAATARALGYGPGAFRKILAQGEGLSVATAMRLQKRLDAAREVADRIRYFMANLDGTAA